MSVKPLYYTFCEYVHPTETSFTIENPNNKARDGVRRSYHLGYLEVVPEYISEAAQNENMDEPDVNPNEIVLENSLEMRLYPGYPPKNPVLGIKYSGKGVHSSDIIRWFNENMDVNKPRDYLYPPVIIDWTAREFSHLEHDGAKFRAHLDRIAQSFYDLHVEESVEHPQHPQQPPPEAPPQQPMDQDGGVEVAPPTLPTEGDTKKRKLEEEGGETAPPPTKIVKTGEESGQDTSNATATTTTRVPSEPVFNPADHRGILPPSVTTGAYNDYNLPTDVDWHDSVRIRITLRPGFKITMTNEKLFQKWGFTEDVYGKRGKNNQFSIVNQTKKVMVFLAEKSPFLDITFDNYFKLNAVHIPENKGYTFPLKTSAAELKKPEDLVAKLQAILKEVFTPIFGYPFDCTVRSNGDQKTVFNLVQNGQIEFRIKLADRLAKILGFNPKKEITGAENTSLAGYNQDATKRLTTLEGLANAELLVLDTGTLNVTVTNVPSITNLGHEFELIACMVGSHHKMVMVKDISPEIEFPQKEREITFLIERNSDKSKKIGLSWTVGAYINGVLIGNRV